MARSSGQEGAVPERVIARAAKALGAGTPVVVPTASGYAIAVAASRAVELASLWDGRPALTVPERRLAHTSIAQPRLVERLAIDAALSMGLTLWLAAPPSRSGLGLRLAEHSVERALLDACGSHVFSIVTPSEEHPALSDFAVRHAERLGRPEVMEMGPIGVRPHASALMVATGVVVQRAPSAAATPARIHFLCLGNLNRSAFAQARFERQIAADKALAAELGGVLLPVALPSSAGTIADPESSCPSGLVEASRRYGCDELLQTHIPRRFVPAMARAGDRLVPLDRSVQAQLLDLGLAGQSEWIGKEQHLPDPMGGPVEGYHSALAAVDAFMARAIFGRPSPYAVG